MSNPGGSYSGALNEKRPSSFAFEHLNSSWWCPLEGVGDTAVVKKVRHQEPTAVFEVKSFLLPPVCSLCFVVEAESLAFEMQREAAQQFKAQLSYLAKLSHKTKQQRSGWEMRVCKKESAFAMNLCQLTPPKIMM